MGKRMTSIKYDIESKIELKLTSPLRLYITTRVSDALYHRIVNANMPIVFDHVNMLQSIGSQRFVLVT
jgi:hypothetical protein